MPECRDNGEPVAALSIKIEAGQCVIFAARYKLADLKRDDIQGHNRDWIGVKRGENRDRQIDGQHAGYQGCAEHLQGTRNQAGKRTHRDAARYRMAVNVPKIMMSQPGG